MPLQNHYKIVIIGSGPAGRRPLSIPHAPISPPWCSKAVNRVGSLP